MRVRFKINSEVVFDRCSDTNINLLAMMNQRNTAEFVMVTIPRRKIRIFAALLLHMPSLERSC